MTYNQILDVGSIRQVLCPVARLNAYGVKAVKPGWDDCIPTHPPVGKSPDRSPTCNIMN